jgi:hypothetical protein
MRKVKKTKPTSGFQAYVSSEHANSQFPEPTQRHDAVFMGHYHDSDMYFSEDPTPSLIFVDESDEVEFPYSIHRIVMVGMAWSKRSDNLLKKLTLARLLADAMGYREAELLIEVKRG